MSSEVGDSAIPLYNLAETSSSSESIARQALQNASRRCLRDSDEFSAKLMQHNQRRPASSSSGSWLTFEPHPLYPIEEVTEDSALLLANHEPKASFSEQEMMERVKRIKQVSAGARNQQRPVSRRADVPRILRTEVTERINHHESITQNLIDRLLEDQMHVHQEEDRSSSPTKLTTRSKSTTPENSKTVLIRVIRKLCCSCSSGQ